MNKGVQYVLDLYLLSELDKKIGHPKINEPRIRKYGSHAGIPRKTIDDYLDFRTSRNDFSTDVNNYYINKLKDFYKKDPLNWSRLE